MSIAQLRATRISPHLLLVALVLAAVAALALTLAPAKGAAWDTRVYFDHDNDDVMANTAVASAMTSATANAGTDTQAHTIFTNGSTVAEGTASSLEIVSEMGLAAPGSAVNIQLSVTLGNIGVANGPKLTNLGAVAGSTAGDEVTLVPIIFVNGTIGVSAITADNVGGAGANVAGALTVRGPIDTLVLAVDLADQLLATGATSTAITATAKDGDGGFLVDGRKIVFQSSNPAAGNFTGSGAAADVADITGNAGAATVTFIAGATGGVSTDITAFIGGVASNTIAIRVGGPVAALALSVTRVTAVGDGTTVAGGELFALANAELGFSDNALVRIAATDSTGGATESAMDLVLVSTAPAGGDVMIGMAADDNNDDEAPMRVSRWAPSASATLLPLLSPVRPTRFLTRTALRVRRPWARTPCGPARTTAPTPTLSSPTRWTCWSRARRPSSTCRRLPSTRPRPPRWPRTRPPRSP